MFDMTHDEIAEFAAERMRKRGYHMSWANMRSVSCGEQPDVLALKNFNDVVVIEVKVSRADFFADRKKPWRKAHHGGIGTERIYLTPPDLLRPEEIPYGWQLWEVHGKKRKIIKVIKGRKVAKVPAWNYEETGNLEDGYIYPYCEKPSEIYHFRKIQNRAELFSWLLVIMRRLAKSGVEVEKFGNCEHMKEMGVFD